MNPRISVVIPAYNEEKYLPRCLEALKKQTFSQDKYEIIVVDNNSADKTSEVAKNYGVKVLLFTSQQGVSATRQYGVTHATAEIIAFTDADISVSKTWLEDIDKIMNNEHILCMGGSVYPREKTSYMQFLFWLYDMFLVVHQWWGKVLPWGSNMIVRKSALEAVGGFDPEIKSAEDWDVAVRIQKKFGKKAALYDASLMVLTETRKHSDPKVFARYLWAGVINYWNFIILGNTKMAKMIDVR
jgi:glycosyltransferase involved in cell wall biosynthesis